MPAYTDNIYWCHIACILKCFGSSVAQAIFKHIDGFLVNYRYQPNLVKISTPFSNEGVTVNKDILTSTFQWICPGLTHK